jgi:hypothetical protein
MRRLRARRDGLPPALHALRSPRPMRSVLGAPRALRRGPQRARILLRVPRLATAAAAAPAGAAAAATTAAERAAAGAGAATAAAAGHSAAKEKYSATGGLGWLTPRRGTLALRLLCPARAGKSPRPPVLRSRDGGRRGPQRGAGSTRRARGGPRRPSGGRRSRPRASRPSGPAARARHPRRAREPTLFSQRIWTDKLNSRELRSSSTVESSGLSRLPSVELALAPVRRPPQPKEESLEQTDSSLGRSVGVGQCGSTSRYSSTIGAFVSHTGETIHDTV